MARAAQDCMRAYTVLLKSAANVANSLQAANEGLGHSEEQVSTWASEASHLNEGTRSLKAKIQSMRTFAMKASGS